MTTRRHLVRSHHVSPHHVRGHRVRAHYSYENPSYEGAYESYNPLGAAAKVALGVAALVAVGTGVYFATRPASAAATGISTAPAVPASVQQALQTSSGTGATGKTYTAVVQSAVNPAAAFASSGFLNSVGQPLAASDFTQVTGSPGSWTTNTLNWYGAQGAAVPAIAGITWVSLA